MIAMVLTPRCGRPPVGRPGERGGWRTAVSLRCRAGGACGYLVAGAETLYPARLGRSALRRFACASQVPGKRRRELAAQDRLGDDRRRRRPRRRRAPRPSRRPRRGGRRPARAQAGAWPRRARCPSARRRAKARPPAASSGVTRKRPRARRTPVGMAGDPVAGTAQHRRDRLGNLGVRLDQEHGPAVSRRDALDRREMCAGSRARCAAG